MLQYKYQDNLRAEPMVASMIIKLEKSTPLINKEKNNNQNYPSYLNSTCQIVLVTSHECILV